MNVLKIKNIDIRLFLRILKNHNYFFNQYKKYMRMTFENMDNLQLLYSLSNMCYKCEHIEDYFFWISFHQKCLK